MKKKLVILFIMLSACKISFSQVTLDYTYPASSTGNSVNFALIEIYPGEYKYAFYDMGASNLSLYNLNHTLFQSITIPATFNGNDWFQVMYVTRSLFDCDTSNIEYLLNYGFIGAPGGTTPYVKIVRDNGTVLFTETNASALTQGWANLSMGPVYSTPNGAKMDLYNANWDLKIYSLCGQLPPSYLSGPGNTTGLSSGNAENFINRVYPNPSKNKITIDYSFPDDVRQAELFLYDANGKETRRLKIGPAFKSVQLDTDGMNAGVYNYVINADGRLFKGSQLVIVK